MKVRDLRKKKNLTQEEFASEIGLKRTTYATYEQEGSFPEEVLSLISRKFNVPLEDLLLDNKLEDEKPGSSKVQDIVLQSHAQAIAAKDKLIEHLERQLTERKGVEKLLWELSQSMHSAQGMSEDALTRSLAVQEVLLESLSEISKKSVGEIHASVRIKEAEIRKAALQNKNTPVDSGSHNR